MCFLLLFTLDRVLLVRLGFFVELQALRSWPLKKTVTQRNSQELPPNFVCVKVVFLNPRTYSGGEVCFVDVFISLIPRVFQCKLVVCVFVLPQWTEQMIMFTFPSLPRLFCNFLLKCVSLVF